VSRGSDANLQQALVSRFIVGAESNSFLRIKPLG